MDNIYIGKIISIITFLLIFLCTIIIALTPTATGYEISIYNAFPFYFWGLIIFAQLMGILILFRSYLNEFEQSNWKYGFLSILLTNSILLSIALIRNYFILGRNDVLTLIGFMNNILITGSFGQDLYPMLHILGVETFLVPGLGLNILTLIYPLIFSLFAIISFYLLFNRIFEDKKNVILAMIPASILLFGSFQTTLSPNQETFLLIPFFLYSYFCSRQSNKKFQFAIITLIFALLITLSHPLVAVIIILLLIIIEFSSNISAMLTPKNTKIRSPYNIIIYMLIIFVMWQSLLYLFIKDLKQVFNWFGGQETASSQLQLFSLILVNGKPHLLDVIYTFFSIYGQLIIMGLIAIITIIYLLKNKEKLNFFNIFSSIGFIVFSIWSAITLVVIHIFGFQRIYVITILFTIFLAFTFLQAFLSSKNKILNKSYVKPLILCLIFIPLIFFSNFNLYFSPPIKTPNEQVSSSEYFGMQTFFEIRDDNFKVIEYGLSQTRFFNAIYYYGNISNGSIISSKNLAYENSTPIDHFGYDNYTSIIDYYNRTSYLIVNDYGKELYPGIYPEYKDKWKFTPEDFDKLNEDKRLSLIYDNSNLQIYFMQK